MVGKKFDDGKIRWDCVPFEIIEGLAKVMTYGAKKYNENPIDPNWRKVENGYHKYFAALMRHLVEDRKGTYLDPESGLPHMSHVLFNAVCLCKFAEDRYNKDNMTEADGN